VVRGVKTKLRMVRRASRMGSLRRWRRGEPGEDERGDGVGVRLGEAPRHGVRLRRAVGLDSGDRLSDRRGRRDVFNSSRGNAGGDVAVRVLDHRGARDQEAQHDRDDVGADASEEEARCGCHADPHERRRCATSPRAPSMAFTSSATTRLARAIRRRDRRRWHVDERRPRGDPDLDSSEHRVRADRI